MSCVPYYAIDTSCRSAECYHSPKYKKKMRKLAEPATSEPPRSPEVAKFKLFSNILHNLYGSRTSSGMESDQDLTSSTESITVVPKSPVKSPTTSNLWKSWVFKK